MSVENYLQEATAFATLAGILGGFAFAAVVELLGSEKQSRVLTASIITFALSSMLSFYAVIVFVFSLAATAETDQVLPGVDAVGAGGMIALLGGVYVFLIGVAIAGWVRSRAAGIATTVFAAITTCTTSFAIFNILMAMPPGS